MNLLFKILNIYIKENNEETLMANDNYIPNWANLVREIREKNNLIDYCFYYNINKPNITY